MNDMPTGDTLSEPSFSVPVFAVVGKVNTGKSSVLATLLEVDDDRVIRVSATPGETIQCQKLPLKFNGKECIRFIDTPGFNRAIDAKREIEAIHAELGFPGTPGLDSIRAFVDRHAGDGEFEDECLLLGPLIDGAGLLYVIDPSKPLRDEFIAEMEILRWTGRRRMALLNAKGDEGIYWQEWKERLGSYFNLVRTFNAHQARFEERRKLLKSLLEIDEDHAGLIEATVRSLDAEWRDRREESAEVLVEVLENALTLRKSRVLDERDMKVDHRREKIKKDMAAQYYRKISKLVAGGVDDLLRIYRHHLVKVDWEEFQWDDLDLEAAETWSKWGLSRSQLVMAATATGAAAGAAVDAATAFLSHGAGALIGGVGGGVAAFFKGDSLPDLKVDLQSGVKFQGGEGRKLELGPPASENFPWILLDRMLAAYRQILQRAHGRRDRQMQAASNEDGGVVQSLNREQRRLLGKWFGSCAKGAPDRGLEPEIYRLIVTILEEVER
jgi:hypothetical protein